MKCPACSAEIIEENRFCEECGISLTSPFASAAAACAKCGATPEATDAEGFCSACGFRRETRGRDHLELVISPWFAGVTDRGLRHYRNEDAVALQWLDAQGTSVLVVCDGVSSTQEADRASETASTTVLRSLIGAILRDRQTPGNALRNAIASAQAAVVALASGRDTQGESPATTIVCATVNRNKVAIGWLGDSRAYWIGNGEARALTRDHSWLTDVISSGEMSDEDARQSPHAHTITRWLGADAPDDSSVPVVQFDIQEPGQLLLCSDGLWNYLSEPAAIAEFVRSPGKDAIDIVRELIDFANARGGHDNITVALLNLDQPILDQSILNQT